MQTTESLERSVYSIAWNLTSCTSLPFLNNQATGYNNCKFLNSFVLERMKKMATKQTRPNNMLVADERIQESRVEEDFKAILRNITTIIS